MPELQNNKSINTRVRYITYHHKNRIRKKTEEELDEDPFGFRQGVGTREPTLALRVLTEIRLNVNRNTFITFIDL